MTPEQWVAVNAYLAAIPEAERNAVRSKIVEPLWRAGNLAYKYDSTQTKIISQLETCAERIFFLLCSRRLGKTRSLLTKAFSFAIQKPGARILYLAPYAKDASEIATDIAAQILEDCPPALKPEYKAQSKEFVFKNGSIIRLKGVNGESAQFLRGGAADLVIMDEAGTMDNFKVVLNSVVLPMTMTTGGKIYIATTPAVTPGHDSLAVFEQVAATGAYAEYTILDNPRLSPETITEFLTQAGEAKDDCPKIIARQMLPKTTTALREYFCKWVTDASSAVLPEFPAAQAEIVRESPRPEYFDSYVALDPGHTDRTGIVYAYYDFLRGKVVVEDESLLERPSTHDMATEILAKEYQLWGDKKPYMRVSDVDPRLIADFWQRHQLRFVQTEKQDSLGAINFVRNLIQTRQLEINPRCKSLIRQCNNAVWNRKATDFQNTGRENVDAHFDLVAALKYLCRNVNFKKNPYPDGYLARPKDPNVFYHGRVYQRNAKPKLGLLQDTPLMRKLAGKKRN